MKTNSPTTQHPRSGFTLLELLAVITIISILLALILPAISGVMRNARVAEAAAEMTRLSTGISAFKSEFGIEPWSVVILPEDPGSTPWNAESRTRIRKIWPQYSFTSVNDFNADGDTTDELILSASECLVFFLGGVKRPGSNAVLGFSKNPINPFTAQGENRTLPFEFNPDQIVDTDGDGMLEYMDTLPGQTTPLRYISSNNGQGYSKSNGSLNYYVSEDGTTALKANSFQIISPGEDGDFGFDPAPNPFDSSGGSTDSRPRYADGINVPTAQADNVASFNPSGTLGN